MSKRSLIADSAPTRLEDLSDWQTFCTAYYEPIVNVFLFLRRSEADADDLAHSFFLKVADGRFLRSYRKFQAEEAIHGRRTLFRSYLYRSLQNHARDDHRRSGRFREQGLGLGAATEMAAGPDRSLDPDALYALDVLHQTIQALRTHSERSGKPHLWVAFEETFLAQEFWDRRPLTRPELLERIGRDDPQALDNGLTTAKRSFRRLLQEVLFAWPGEGDPSDRFDEWMEILRRCNASQFNLLHLAYRVVPHLGDSEHANSDSMVVREPEVPGHDPDAPGTIADDEMAILLGFWLEMPLTRWLDVEDWSRLGPILDPPHFRKGSPTSAGRRERPTCLLTFLDPTGAESERLRGVDLVETIARLKSLAKQLHLRADHSVPVAFSELVYTAMSTLAMVRHQTSLHSIGPASLARNIRWFLGRPWLDARLRPLFEAGLAESQAWTDGRIPDASDSP